MSWLESKLENTTVEKVVRRKYLERIGQEADTPRLR